VSETQIETYKDWEIALVCRQHPKTRAGVLLFIGFAYIRPTEKQERRWPAPRCLVSCDHVPRRSMALFRAKAVLDELIADLRPRPYDYRGTSMVCSTA
jgi:hypothetical protein